MHSRIFQISKNPIKKEDYIKESNYWDHWFLNEVADYVSDDCDAYDDVKWLQDCVKGIIFGGDENGTYLVVVSREEYFRRSFEKFKITLDKVKDCTIEEFSTGIHEMWQLKDLYEEKFGFYVDVDGELMSFDSFVRLCATKEKYYIGGTIDYHC